MKTGSEVGLALAASVLALQGCSTTPQLKEKVICVPVNVTAGHRVEVGEEGSALGAWVDPERYVVTYLHGRSDHCMTDYRRPFTALAVPESRHVAGADVDPAALSRLRTFRQTFVVAVPTQPSAFDLEPAAVSHLRTPQALALDNGFQAETTIHLNTRSTRWSTDLMRLTDTARSMLQRAMEARGITFAPQEQRSITLRIHRAAAVGAPWAKSAVLLEARYGDGSSTVVTAENTGFSAQRALDGAVLVALGKLVADEKFVAYVNR
jgi:hypothetical protein